MWYVLYTKNVRIFAWHMKEMYQNEYNRLFKLILLMKIKFVKLLTFLVLSIYIFLTLIWLILFIICDKIKENQ